MFSFHALTVRQRVLYLVWLYLAVLLALTFAVKRDMLLLGNGALLGGLISYWLLRQPQLLLFLAVLASFFYEGITALNGTYIVAYVYVLMLLALLSHYRTLEADRAVLAVSVSCFLLSIVPLFLYGTTGPLLVLSILKRFGFLLVYLFTINLFPSSRRVRVQLIQLITAALLINMLAAFAQFAGGVENQDFITGLFGPGMTGVVMYIFTLHIAIISGLHYAGKLSTPLYFLLCAVPIVYAAIAEVKVGFVTVALIIVFYLAGMLRSSKSVLALVVFAVLFVQLYSLFVSLYPQHNFLSRQFLQSYLVEEGYGGTGTVNRFDFKPQIDAIIMTETVDEWLGKGLGSANPSESATLKGALYDAYDYLKFRWFTIPYLYVEQGILGTSLYVLIYTVPAAAAVREWRKRRSPLSVMVLLMSLTNLMFLPYNAGLLHYGISTLYWTFAAFLFREQQEAQIS